MRKFKPITDLRAFSVFTTRMTYNLCKIYTKIELTKRKLRLLKKQASYIKKEYKAKLKSGPFEAAGLK
jgi:hypothetical protein